MKYYKIHYQGSNINGQRFEMVEVNQNEGEEQAIFTAREYLKHHVRGLRIICAAFYLEDA